jgi:hypothetical protein
MSDGIHYATIQFSSTWCAQSLTGKDFLSFLPVGVAARLSGSNALWLSKP